MMRRSFLSYAVGMLSAVGLAAQSGTSVMEKGKAVVCDAGGTKCPLGHDTCKRIDAPLVVGNGRQDYPDWGQIYDYHMFVCDQCGILFAVKQ
jgi:hypothetical protein